jgi:hypothetical protein
MASATSPSITLEFAHSGSVSVVEATYLGSVLSFVGTGSLGSVAFGHEAAAKISYVRFVLLLS